MPAPPPPAPELFDLDGGSVRVRLTNVGAAVTSLLVPNKNGTASLWYPPSVCLCYRAALSLLVHDILLVLLAGVLADVVLGFDSLDPYLVSSRCVRFDFKPLISALPHSLEISAEVELGVLREIFCWFLSFESQLACKRCIFW
jgi:hypothetical protein